jgi:uncharacterized protein YutD
LIKEYQYRLLSDATAKMVELLNESELASYLINFTRKIGEYSYEELRLHTFIKTQQKKEKLLCSISDIFCKYISYRDNIKLLLKYVSKDAKERFAQEDMEQIFAAKLPDINEYPYGKDFRSKKGTLNEKSTDELLKELLTRANWFITQAISIYDNTLKEIDEALMPTYFITKKVLESKAVRTNSVSRYCNMKLKNTDYIKSILNN